jgi:hypothetical protein
MTQQEIQERNKQIALMLGKLPKEIPFLGYCYSIPEFHSDWNWLMEAVEFIRLQNFSYDMYCPNGIEKDNDGEFECNFWDKINPEIIGRSKTSLKEAIFIAVSDFAKLYNNKQL